jgi:hypothetical protein
MSLDAPILFCNGKLGWWFHCKFLFIFRMICITSTFFSIFYPLSFGIFSNWFDSVLSLIKQHSLQNFVWHNVVLVCSFLYALIIQKWAKLVNLDFWCLRLIRLIWALKNCVFAKRILRQFMGCCLWITLTRWIFIPQIWIIILLFR